MDFVAKYNDLMKAVQSCSRVIVSASPSPILTNILIDCNSRKDEGLVRLFATDLEMYYETFVPAEIKVTGEVMISAKIFTEVLGSFSGDNDLSVSCNKENFNIEIKGGKSETKCTLFGLPPDDFPNLPPVEKLYTFKFSLTRLQSMIRDTLYAASTEQVKPAYCGMCLKVLNNGLRSISTDGKRLAFCEFSMPETQTLEQNEIIIMAKVLHEISKSAADPSGDDIDISICSNQIAFQAKNYSYYARLIEGKFPDYNQVIPKDVKIKLTAKVGETTDNLKKMLPIARENGFTIKMNVASDAITCTAKSTKMGSMVSKSPVSMHQGSDFEINFNVRFFIDILNTIKSEECVMEFTNPQAPVKIYPQQEITNENHIHILMPVRPGFNM